MNEKIIINGMEADRFSGSSLSFEIESNIMKKLEDISCCYSYTHTLPNTTQNKRIFGDILAIGRSGNNAHKMLDAEYYRDDLLIFSGNCFVNNVTESEIEVTFQFGIITALKQIKDDNPKLNELFGNGSYYYDYTDEDVANYKVELPLADALNKCAQYPFTYTKPTEVFLTHNRVSGNDFDANYCTPSVHADAIFNFIKSRYNLVCDFGEANTNYWVMTNAKNRKDKFCYAMYNFESRGKYGVYKHHLTLNANWASEPATNVKALNGNDYDGRHEYNVEPWEDAELSGTMYPYLEMKHDYKVLAVWFYADGFSTDNGYVYYYPDYDINQDRATRKIASWSSTSDKINLMYYPKENAMKYEFKAGDGFTLVIDCASGTKITNIGCVVFCQLDEDDVDNGYFNSIDCLPDISVTEFIHDFAFGLWGKFPINTMQGGNVVKFVNLEDIWNSEAYNWSDKLITTDLKLYTTISGTAQHNYIKYKTGDREVEEWFDEKTADLSLDKEEDFFESAFGKYYNPNFRQYDASTGEKLKPSPKLCSISISSDVSYDGGSFAALTDRNLQWCENETTSKLLMDEIFASPTRLECKIMLSSLDLATLDLSRKVYLEQFGNYFYIQKLSVGEKTTDAVLIKL